MLQKESHRFEEKYSSKYNFEAFPSIQWKLQNLLKLKANNPDKHQELFDALKNELYAHSVAEDRYLYIPLMFDDVGLDITRHALSEHHEMDELVEQLEKTDMSSPSWLATAKQLSEKVHHHLKEEEHKFFQQAGKILKDSEKETLGNKYLKEYKKYKKQQ